MASHNHFSYDGHMASPIRRVAASAAFAPTRADYRPLVVMALLLSVVVSCQRTIPSRRAVVEIPSPGKDDGGTRISEGGCTVRLPGVWKQLPNTDGAEGTWAAEINDGTEVLEVLLMDWEANVGDVPEDIRAILNLRRDADMDQRGPQVRLSDIEVLPNAAWYTLVDPQREEMMATMVKASRKLACVFFLTCIKAQPEQFRRYAKSVLENAVVER